MGGQKFSIFQFLIPGTNPDNVYWLLIQPSYWNWTNFLGNYYYTSSPVRPGNLNVGRGMSKLNCDFTASFFGKVNFESKTMSDFTNYQQDKNSKKFYYLCPTLPFLLTENNTLTLFGTQSMSAGKRLWFLRLGLE